MGTVIERARGLVSATDDKHPSSERLQGEEPEDDLAGTRSLALQGEEPRQSESRRWHTESVGQSRKDDSGLRVLAGPCEAVREQARRCHESLGALSGTLVDIIVRCRAIPINEYFSEEGLEDAIEGL